MKGLPLLTDDNRVEDKREISVLHARLEKTLKFFERDQVVDVIIFRHSEPIVYSKPGVVILISTEVLKIVRDDDDALVGVIAHELAHEFVALEFLKALQFGNLSRMRELELFCDAVAVVAMLQLGFDPSRFARAVKVIATQSQKSAELNGGENSHPAVEARLRVISYVSATLSQPKAGSRRSLQYYCDHGAGLRTQRCARSCSSRSASKGPASLAAMLAST